MLELIEQHSELKLRKKQARNLCVRRGEQKVMQRGRPAFSPSLLKGWCHLAENIVGFAVDLIVRTSTSCM